MSTEVETSLNEGLLVLPRRQEIPPLRFAPVGMTKGGAFPITVVLPSARYTQEQPR